MTTRTFPLQALQLIVSHLPFHPNLPSPTNCSSNGSTFFRSTFSNSRVKRLHFDRIPSPSFCFHFSLLIRRFLSFFCVVHFSSTVSARGRKTKSNWLGKRRQRLNWEGREKIGHRRVNYRQGRDKHQEARPVLVRQEDQLEDRWIQRGIQKSQTIKMKQVRLNSW